MKKWSLRLCVVALALSVSGCGAIVGSVVGEAMDVSTRRVGQEIGNRISGAILADIGPRMIRSYTIGLMQLLFYQGGYSTELGEYQPGQYTVWQSDNADFGQTLERAFLRREEDGREWWRMEAYSKDEDSGEEFHLVMEALFRVEEDGTRHIRRLRVKYPNDPEAQEVPITEDNASQWVVRADRLTEESMEGMKVGAETVTVPAGTFNTLRYRTSGASHAQVESNWWVAEADVPGRVVRFEHINRGDSSNVQTVELVQYGNDATESALGVF